MENQEIKERLEEIQLNNSRDGFIEDYIPFVVKTTSKITGRYVNMNDSDEFSIALIAFNEAIDKYDDKKGSFIAFASLVIKNRLYDYLNKKKINLVSLSDQTMESHLISHNDFTERLDLKNEIDLFTSKLNTFGLTLDELVVSSPKHQKTRLRSLEMSKYIISIETLISNFYRLKRLPVLVLSEAFQVAKKTIKRHRKFTIATTLVLDSDLELIKSRVLQIERGDHDV